MSLRPSPSPSPAPPNNLKPINTRASLQPTQRDQPIPRTPNNNNNGTNNPISPRPLGINTSHGRPTSELLNPGSGVAFQTPEGEFLLAFVAFFCILQLAPSRAVVPDSHLYVLVDAIDQWFENLQNYETTLVRLLRRRTD